MVKNFKTDAPSGGGGKFSKPGQGGQARTFNKAPFNKAPFKRGPPKILIIPHRLEGVYITKGIQDALVTLNYDPGISVYNEKRISQQIEEQKIEYRVWNPYRSKIAAAIVGGLSEIYIKPGSRVLYLGAASGTTVSHVSDIVGAKGIVFAVEFAHRSGRDLVNMCKRRNNIIPIIHDARKPLDYRF